MKEIKRMISRISGHRNRESYAILSYAVDVARRYQPQEPKMETIVSEVADTLGQRKGTAAISRSLSRVAMDIWEFGNRRELERILGRHLEEPPTPRELVLRLAEYAFAGDYDRETLLHWLKNFYRRFFAQQFKRSCLPDGPKVGTVALSPRGDWRMPSDAAAALWLQELETLEP